MKKILAIDDHYTNLVLIQSSLKLPMPDCEVYFAYSGKEGIQIAKEINPDTILLDVLMPEMSGFEVCKILKSDDLTKNIPIMMVSALGIYTEDRVKGLDAGADAFITKPFNRNELVSQLKVLLRIKSAEDALRKQNENLEIFIKKQTKDFNINETRFLEISEYALEYFWEIDACGKYTYVSPVIEKILGYNSKEIIGKKFLFDFPILNDDETSMDALSKIFYSKGMYQEFEIQSNHHNNSPKWLKISGFPIYDKSSNFIGYRGVTHDITISKQTGEDLKKSLEEIKSYQIKLKKLNSELNITEEAERRRIAEYLHDGVGQILSITHINLSSLLGKELLPEIHKTINTSIEYLNKAIIQTRSLTYDLSPPILYELGLIPAIKWKLDQLTKESGLHTSFDSKLNHLEINNDTSVLIYRILCELFLNIIKHANADSVDVVINKEENAYLFVIIDDGNGFNYEHEKKIIKHGGYGLFSINERLESINGSLNIESMPNKGTKAIIQILTKQV